MADGGTVPEAPKTGFDLFAEKLNNGVAVTGSVEIALEVSVPASSSVIAPLAHPIFEIDPSPSAAVRKRNVPKIFGNFLGLLGTPANERRGAVFGLCGARGKNVEIFEPNPHVNQCFASVAEHIEHIAGGTHASGA